MISYTSKNVGAAAPLGSGVPGVSYISIFDLVHYFIKWTDHIMLFVDA